MNAHTQHPHTPGNHMFLLLNYFVSLELYFSAQNRHGHNKQLAKVNMAP